MSTSNSTLERPTVNDAAEDDTLTHIFCKPCEMAAKRRAKKPVPFCGKEKIGPWMDRDNHDGKLCVVCTEMVNSPCPRCGFRSRL